MLDRPLDFYFEIENGNLLQLSPAMFEFLRKHSPDAGSNDSNFIYRSTQADAIAVWVVSDGENSKYYARQLYTQLYSSNGKGSITTTYIGDPLDETPHPYAFALTNFEGELSSLSFLRRYRFNNLQPVRKFIHFIGSNLRTANLEDEFYFLMYVRPDCYVSNPEPDPR